MAVRMGYEKDKTATCRSCNNKIDQSKEMYKIGIGEKDLMLVFNLCDECANKMFKKILKAQCDFQSRLKSQAEIAKFNKIDRHRGKGVESSNISINEAMHDIEK